MSIRAGRLNRRILIEKPGRVSNGEGGFTKEWVSAGGAWAEMIPLRGGEALSHLLQKSTQLWKITIRWRGDIAPDWRLSYQGQPLNIRTSVDPTGKREELVMTAETGVAT